ncbi:MAG: DUF1254 domain-containing protein [Pseudomonadota bacterium]
MPGTWFSILRLRTWVLLVFAIGIVHIVTTLWLARTHEGAPFVRFHAGLERARFTVLSELTPATQPLPFLMPEAHYAVCPFDLTDRSLEISAALKDIGWVLSLHSLDGQSFYYAPGSDSGTINIDLHIVPPGEELNGVEVAIQSRARKIAQVEAPSVRGLAILRAPINARAYVAEVVRDLQESRCRPVGLQQRGRQVQSSRRSQSRS